MRYIFLSGTAIQPMINRGDLGHEELEHAALVLAEWDLSWMDQLDDVAYRILGLLEGPGCRLSVPLGGRDSLLARLNRMLEYLGYRKVSGNEEELAALGQDVEQLAARVREVNADLDLMVVV